MAERWAAAGSRPRPGEPLPATLPAFVVRTGALHQIALSALSVLLFLIGVAPLALQRQIVDLAVGRAAVGPERAPDATGTGIAVLIAEADPVGAFVGASLSEPLLKAGLLLSVFGYLAWLQPLLGALACGVLLPQAVLVPPMQTAINRRIGARILELRRISDAVAARDAAPTLGVAARIHSLLRINLGLFGLKFAMNCAMNAFQHLGVTVVLMVGGLLVASGRTDIGTVVACISGLAKVNDPWGDLVDWFRDVYATRAKYALIRDSVLAGTAAISH